MKRILLIPKIKVLNANALSSPYTIGFPAMTAWLGFMHALQRQLRSSGKFAKLSFESVAVIAHSMDLQVHKEQGEYIHSIIATANPLQPKEGSFKRPPFIEEARCHLTVSLAIEYDGVEKDGEDELLKDVKLQMHKKMKIAGGDILDFCIPEACKVIDDVDLKTLNRKLMPGYAIVERRDLMFKAMRQGQDAIDALLDCLTVKHTSEEIEIEQGKSKVQWSCRRKEAGWIVPIATGFHGITELAQAKNQREQNVSHRFAESVVTLGEFVMPYRISNLDNMLWHYRVDPENSLYLCQQKEPLNLTSISTLTEE